MKKGFTLVELLAVIVILAVILTIAVPAVKKTVDSAKKKSAENDALMIKKIAEKYYTSKLDEDNEVFSIDLSEDTLTYSGEKPSKGYFYFNTDGIAYGKMYINGYCVEVKVDGTIESEKVDNDSCDITSIPGIYRNGEVIYYNPETNTKCSSSEAVSTTGTKTGCMKWYVFNYDGSEKVNLILDHNTTANVAWSSDDSNITGPKVANAQLESDTSSWNSSLNARLIEASEIAKITENSGWTAGGEYYYFHTNSTTKYTGEAGTNKYAWLFDNTTACTTSGCNVATTGVNGYWTGTGRTDNTRYSWYVRGDGTLYCHIFTINENYCGIRPVITVSKSIIS